MKFHRLGNHTIKCVISEAEIEAMGYTIDDIISNSVKTQEFMNTVFDKAEQELQIKFALGAKSVRADIMPDHTISLTFSEKPGTEGMAENIKDIINGLLSAIPKEALEGIRAIGEKEMKKEAVGEKKYPTGIIVLFAFEDLDILMRYAKQVHLQELPFNQLYKFEDVYFLMIDVTNCDDALVKRLSALTDEYATDTFVGAEKRAFIYEHGTAILEERAIEQLREV